MHQIKPYDLPTPQWGRGMALVEKCSVAYFFRQSPPGRPSPDGCGSFVHPIREPRASAEHTPVWAGPGTGLACFVCELVARSWILFLIGLVKSS